MTTLTFSVLVLLTVLTVGTMFGSWQAVRAVRNRRPGGRASLTAGLAVVLASGTPTVWQVVHYFDIKDGVMDDPVGPFPPYLILSGVLLAGAIATGLIALMQLLLSRPRDPLKDTALPPAKQPPVSI